MEVEVVFAYEPQHEDELRLSVGDIITQVTRLETGWFQGKLHDTTGVFPDNFVKVLSKEVNDDAAESNVTTPPDVQKRGECHVFT
ncbi:SH3 domain-containing kinase-binding protein 1-like [Cherax quadricarinatus]|uniref:SH3 domain-containing kinase-binding protein 1-like n=1 Tax=Cherax quadricarinatus TaxID=27406 RepID=UPI00387ED66F